MSEDGTPHAEQYMIDLNEVLEDVTDFESIEVLEAEPGEHGKVRVTVTEEPYHRRHGLTLEAAADALRDRIETTDKEVSDSE